jgi:hypothetical protein
MSGRTFEGLPLTPGYNVDLLDIAEGKRAAAEQFGYADWQAQMVVEYALQRHARGEEAGAVATWRGHYPHDLTSWHAILACATVVQT